MIKKSLKISKIHSISNLRWMVSLLLKEKIALLTCRTLLVRPVFCASCFKSLASGLWLIAKYDFIVRNWWCLNDVLIRFVF